MSLCSTGLYGNLHNVHIPLLDYRSQILQFMHSVSQHSKKTFHLFAHNQCIDWVCALTWECLSMQRSLQGARPIISSCVVCFFTVAGSFRPSSPVRSVLGTEGHRSGKWTTDKSMVYLARKELTMQGLSQKTL